MSTSETTRESADSFMRRRSFGEIFLISALIVVGLATSATVVVDLLVSPALLRFHLNSAHLPQAQNVMEHAELAARSANGIALAVSLVVGIVAAILSSLYLSHRMNAAMAQLATASKEIYDGDYSMRVQEPSLGKDLSQVVDSFNAMTQRLEHTETSRKRLFSDLAHEIRTPLAVINAQLEALDDGVSTLAESEATLRAQTERLVSLSDDLTLLSRAEEGRLPYVMKRIDLTTVVESCVASMRAAYLKKGVELTLRRTATAPILGDAQRLSQVLGNLLANALHATDAGGEVTIDATADTEFVSVRVADSGKGMTADQISHIFERLYRAESSRDRSDGGSGLGLAISRELVAAHGGSLDARSAGLGKGSSFTMKIPVD